MNLAAQKLGRMAKGKPKNFSAAEIERREETAGAGPSDWPRTPQRPIREDWPLVIGGKGLLLQKLKAFAATRKALIHGEHWVYQIALAVYLLKWEAVFVEPLLQQLCRRLMHTEPVSRTLHAMHVGFVGVGNNVHSPSFPVAEAMAFKRACPAILGSTGIRTCSQTLGYSPRSDSANAPRAN